jgi:hypothetical protein
MILPFELDPQIIHHIIYSQAGSIGKAIGFWNVEAYLKWRATDVA